MTESSEVGALLAAVTALRDRVDQAAFPLSVGGADEARSERRALLAQLDDYVIPRLVDIDAPLLAVVGGSTGAGKSTLVNSILARRVSRSGVLRPTTRSCVLVHHPDDERWFTTPRILPNLNRISGHEGEAGLEDPSALRLVSVDTLPPGVAVLDAPDIDSVVAANRNLARQLLAAADLWVFVTTAARYADAVPWDLLRQSVERGTSVSVVLDRVPPGAEREISAHLKDMLVAEGLRDAPVFTVTESALGSDGMLPDEQVAPLRDWLARLGEDARARGVVVRRTLAGALDSMDRRVEGLARASAEQVETASQLDDIVTSAYGSALHEVSAGMSDGRLLRGEVLARWQEFVGTGEFLKQIEVGFGRLRDRITAAITGRPAPATELGEALQSGVAQLLVAHAEGAGLEVARRWRAVPGSEDLLVTQPAAQADSTEPGRSRVPAVAPEIGAVSPDLPERAETLVREWQSDILDLVRSEGKDRRTTARVLSMGVNAVGVVLMLVVFSHTMGTLGGAEVGIAGGSAVLAQRLLEAVFGDQAVRTLAAKARAQLLERTQALYDEEADRLRELVARANVRPEQAAELDEAARDLRAAR
ncbi:dynamin family protein [Piscicoccus intestinalis]|uniref:dynamin family protein n=1 Tax=Piscicoccus intestinalis TaxID=746033 RepID=UPI0008382F06|nr:dynamin family protein [Piscicoccus intestinalis]